MSLYTHKETNIRKTWMLMAVFFILIIVLGWIFSYVFEAPEILYIAVAFGVLANVGSYWWSDKLVVMLTRAQPADPEEFKELHRIVENLAITAGLPKPRVYIMEDPSPNAFATGRNPEKAVVAVTTGLLNILERSELEAVIAHELSHIGNRDMLVSTVAVVLAGFISILSDFFLRVSFYGGGRSRGRGAGGLLVLFGLIVVILAPIAAFLIRLAISRKREFLADASAALLTRYPEGLASALEKIGRASQPLLHAHDATAHLFIFSPFGPKASQGFHRLFMTHPPIEERVRALRSR